MRTLALITTALILNACSTQPPSSRPDSHDCLETQGYYWSAAQLSCINAIEHADETLHHPTLGTVYLIFSNHDEQVELFGAHIPAGTLLFAQNNNLYQSPHSAWQLIRQNDHWQIMPHH